jgi:hypothetical protein
MFRNHGTQQIECDGRTLEDSKSFLLVLPTVAGMMEQVCVRAWAHVGATLKVTK